MAYFNHAFQKAFIGTTAFNMGTAVPFTSGTGSSVGATITVASTANLVVGMQVRVSAGTGVFSPGTFVTAIPSATTFIVNVAPTVTLSGATVQGSWTSMSQPTGAFTFVDPNTFVAPTLSTFSGHAINFPLVLASGSVHGQWTSGKDKIGPFHGGYTESIKSKMINPKFISNFYRVDPCPIQQAQVTIGENTTTSVGTPGSCSQEYLCNETYYLRVDLKGSPALRYLTRNSYYTASAYTGCCSTTSIAPTAVNPLLVYVNWAFQLLNSPLIGNFIQVQVTYSTDGGTTYVALGDGSNSAANVALLQAYTLGTIALPANATPSLTKAGLIINGAYGDTRFQDCTFYPNDSIIAFLEPIQVFASEVDLNGDPCAFSGVCINNTCRAIQQKGTGENIIRSVIMTQAYSQDPFYNGNDLRIREITNGTDVYGTINRFASYSRYYLQHSVPRFNNPTGTFDNDQYLLEIVAPATVSLTLSAASGTGAVVINAANAINFTTNGVSTGFVTTITFTPPGGVAGVIATATVTVVANTSITIASVTTTIPAGSVITFQPAYTRNFEEFMVQWINNAQGTGTGTAMFSAATGAGIYNCPASCTVVPTNP